MITIHALGDSLVKAYGEESTMGGWGDHLWSFFDTDKVQTRVYAQGGRSSRSFLNEGRFIDNGSLTMDIAPYLGPAYPCIKPGDYVFIQFCHNDDSSKEKRTYVERLTPLGDADAKGIYPVIVPAEAMKVSTAALPEEYEGILAAEGNDAETIAKHKAQALINIAACGDMYFPYNCGATYKGYLKFYVDKVREAGAVPVLITAPARQMFREGKIAALPWNHGGKDAFGDFPYIRAMRQLAAEENVMLLDLFARSIALYETFGEQDAKEMQASQTDDTHQNKFGSYLFAAFISDELFEKNSELIPSMNGYSVNKMPCPDVIQGRMPEIQALYKFIKEI